MEKVTKKATPKKTATKKAAPKKAATKKQSEENVEWGKEGTNHILIQVDGEKVTAKVEGNGKKLSSALCEIFADNKDLAKLFAAAIVAAIDSE